MSARGFSTDEWKAVVAEADARKTRHRFERTKEGTSSVEGERASVAAEYAFLRLMGKGSDESWALVTAIRRDPGITFDLGAGETYRVHAVHEKSHTHLIQKVKDARADWFIFAFVDTRTRELTWRGWTTLDEVKRAGQQTGTSGVPSYWVPQRALDPMDDWFRRGRARPQQQALFAEPVLAGKKRRAEDDDNDPHLR